MQAEGFFVSHDDLVEGDPAFGQVSVDLVALQGHGQAAAAVGREHLQHAHAALVMLADEARQIAVKRMVDEAMGLGADAVIGVKYGSSQVMSGAAEVIAYGTAVKIIQ